MPRIRRRQKQRRHITLSDLTIPDILDLKSGWRPERAGMVRFSEGIRPRSLTAFETIEDVRAFYEDHRELFAKQRTFKGPQQRGDTLGHWPGERAWVWWKFDSPEPRDESILQREQLLRMGLLSDEEKQLIDWNRSY